MKTALPFFIAFQALLAMQGPDRSGDGAAPAHDLRIVVLAGEGVINDIVQHSANDIAVRIEDADGRPAHSALVLFSLPAEGPSGTFGKEESSYTTVADQNGRAATKGFKPNSLSGKVPVRINATYLGRSAAAIVTQYNIQVPVPRKRSSAR